MLDWLTSLLDSDGFPPRWQCGTGWTPALGWTHIASDILIWGAYMAIPVVLAYFVIRRKHDVPFPKVFWLFALFIFSCGTTHLVEAAIFWEPVYRLSAATKVWTVIASWGTVAVLIPIAPQALALPGLRKVNEQLEEEIEQRRRSEARLQMLMHELDHRVKNNLATVLTIADQTASSSESIEQFAQSFTGRVGSLARVHTALATARWHGLTLQRVLELVLEPYRDADPPRWNLDGPDVHLEARQAGSLCMVFHELATNAAKYGCLAGPEEVLHVRWERRGEEVSIIWREHGGRDVVQPKEEGYGLRMIRGMLAYDLGGEAEMKFHSDGLECRLTFAVDPSPSGRSASTGAETKGGDDGRT